MNLTSFKTLVLREYWENKSFLWAPVIVSSVILISFIFGVVIFQNLEVSFSEHHSEFSAALDKLSQIDKKELSLVMQGIELGVILSPLMISLFFIMFFYVISFTRDSC